MLNGNEMCVRTSGAEGHRDGRYTINPKYQNILAIVNRVQHFSTKWVQSFNINNPEFCHQSRIYSCVMYNFNNKYCSAKEH